MLSALKFIPRERVAEYVKEKDIEKGLSRGALKKEKRKDRAKDKSKSRKKKKRTKSSSNEDTGSSSLSDSDQGKDVSAREVREEAKTKRKEAGLEWMLHAPERPLGVCDQPKVEHDNPTLDSEKPRSHPRELNPHLASGTDGIGKQNTHKPNSSVVGDGGASWRLKALKRAQETAAREGRKLDEIVGERFGSLGTLTDTLSDRRSAHVNAHLHAIRDRKSRKDTSNSRKGFERGLSPDAGDDKRSNSLRDRASRDDHRPHGSGSQMKVPRVDSNFSWKSTKKVETRPSLAGANVNKHGNDDSSRKRHLTDRKDYQTDRTNHQTDSQAGCEFKPVGESISVGKPGRESSPTDSIEIVYEPTRLINLGGTELRSNSVDEILPERKSVDHSRSANISGGSTSGLSANAVAAKVLRLRLMGKVAEADELLKEYESGSNDRHVKGPFMVDPSSPRQPRDARSNGLDVNTLSAQAKFRARSQSCDAEMAADITRNKLYKGNVEDEYDGYGNGLETQRSDERKGKKTKLGAQNTVRDDSRRIVTRQETCPYCFENPNRPKHLVIAMGNFTYLVMPPRNSLVPFHCYIVPMQHEGATRNVDENVWQEFRNFKKCLVQMLGDQGKKVLFLETAMGLSRQRRHTYIECIPVTPNVAEDAPLYFKKAIDEAEDEWSQHDSRKLIDTQQNGLRKSIPKNFPYFHVEFGMKGGYCHIIDDESSFKPQFGHDVVSGMLEEDDLYGRQKHDSVEEQKKKVKEFLKLWEPFDWTKMLD